MWDLSLPAACHRQAAVINGLLPPDYARCVEISTKAAQRERIGPSLLAIVVVFAGLIVAFNNVQGLLLLGK